MKFDPLRRHASHTLLRDGILNGLQLLEVFDRTAAEQRQSAMSAELLNLNIDTQLRAKAGHYWNGSRDPQKSLAAAIEELMRQSKSFTAYTRRDTFPLGEISLHSNSLNGFAMLLPNWPDVDPGIRQTTAASTATALLFFVDLLNKLNREHDSWHEYFEIKLL